MSFRTDQTVLDLWSSLPEEFKHFVTLLRKGQNQYCWTLRIKHHIITKEPLSNMVSSDEIFEIIYTLKRLFEIDLIQLSDIEKLLARSRKHIPKFEM